MSDRDKMQTSPQRHAAWSRWFWDGLALACLLAGGWSFDRRLALGADFSVNQFLCAALLLRVLFGAWQMRREPVRGRATLGAVVACTAVLLARLPGSANPEYGVFKVVAYLGLIVPVLVYVEATLREPRDLQRWFLLMALAAVGLLLLSLRHVFDLEPGERLAILGGGPNVFARLVGMGILAALVQSLQWRRQGARRTATLAWVGVPLAVLAMVCAGSKAALLALALASLVVLHAAGARRLVRVLVIGMIAGVVIPIVAHPFVQHLNKDGGIVRLLRLPDFEDSFGSYGSRVRFTLGSLEQIRTQPWWGVGTGAWGNALGVGMEGAYPHNFAIEIASETGLVGLVVVLVPFAWFPRRRAIADPITRLHAAGVTAIALFWAINVSLSGDLVDSRYFWLALLLLELHAGSLPRRSGHLIAASAPMKIGILTSVHPPTDTRILFKQAASLVRAGHEVHLVARESPNPIGCGVHHVPLPVPKSRLGRIATCLQLYRKAVAMRCDVYHLHDPELLTVAAGLKRSTGARIIFDVHEDVRRQIRNKYWIPRWMRPPLAVAYGVLERLALRHVDHVVIAEDSYAPVYARYDTVAVRNYPTLQLLAPLGNWSQPREYSRRPNLVYCGTVAKIRGALEMLEAVKILTETFPDVHLSIIGSCFPAELEAEMAAKVLALGIEANVKLHGRLPLDQAMEVVARCDVGLALLHPDPNYLHSLPTKMFEYMALRLPVVVSNFALWKKIVDETGGGRTVDPLSVPEIAAAIGTIVRDADALRAMGQRASIAVRATYSWEAEAKRLLDLYAPQPAAVRDATRQDAAVRAFAAPAPATDLVSSARK